jgi:nicotinamide-nucleotide amidase
MSQSLVTNMKKLLIDNSLTISVAESLTAGLIQSTIGSVSGVSAVYKGGITAYDIDIKCNILGVSRSHASKVNCVSQIVARDMAFGCKNLFNSDIAISTTGYAEAYPDNNILEAHAFVCIHFYKEAITFKVKQPSSGNLDRNDFRVHVMNKALSLLISRLRAGI